MIIVLSIIPRLFAIAFFDEVCKSFVYLLLDALIVEFRFIYSGCKLFIEFVICKHLCLSVACLLIFVTVPLKSKCF